MRTNLTMKLATLLLAVLALLTVGVVVAVKSINLDQIKELLTTQVKTATGRTLTISGSLDLQLGLTPRVVANGVTLSNPPGSTRPDMVKIKHFELEISLLPLLKHEILIKRLIVSSPDILIETEAKGPGNLSFSVPTEKSDPKPAAPATGGGSAYQLNLLEVKIENAVVAQLERSTGKTDSVEVQSLTIQPDKNSSELLAVRLAAKAQGHTIEMNGTVGTFAAAIGGKPWPLHLQGNIEGLAITAEGAIAELFAFRGLSLKLTVQGEELYKVVQLAGVAKSASPQTVGPFKLAARLNDDAGSFTLTDVDAEVGKRDTLLLNAKGAVKDLTRTMVTDFALTMESDNLGGLSRLAGTDIPALGPMKFSGLLRGSGTTWKMADIKATMAGSDLSGELAVDITKRPHISGKLAANTLNINDLTGKTVPAGEKPAAKPAQSAGGDGRIFPNQPLPVQALRSLDIDLTLQAGKLAADDLQFTNIATELHLNGGRLTLKPFHTGLAGGTVEGEVSLDAAGKIPAVLLNMTARQVELGKLGNHKIMSGGKSDLKVNLKGQGESVRALMASLTGETVLSVGEGKMQNKAMNWAAGDLLFQVLGALNPMAKNEDTTSLSCAAARFTILDGIATADKGIAARTDKIDVVGSGTVDLRSENLDLGIRPTPREGVGLSLSSPIAGMTRIRGTLAHPAIGIDAEGSLRTAASVGAAAATGGLSLLGEKLVDKFSADADPCRTALGLSQATKKETPQQKNQPQKQKSGSLFQGMFGR